MTIDISHPMIHFAKEDNTFSAELSDIEKTRFEITNLCYRAAPIWVKNPKTGNVVKMTRFKVDTDGSGEDTYGWWYRGTGVKGRSFKFLFIND